MEKKNLNNAIFIFLYNFYISYFVNMCKVSATPPLRSNYQLFSFILLSCKTHLNISNLSFSIKIFLTDLLEGLYSSPSLV